MYLLQFVHIRLTNNEKYPLCSSPYNGLCLLLALRDGSPLPPFVKRYWEPCLIYLMVTKSQVSIYLEPLDWTSSFRTKILTHVSSFTETKTHKTDLSSPQRNSDESYARLATSR